MVPILEPDRKWQDVVVPPAVMLIVGKRGSGMRLRAGLTFTIEPMINVGTYEVEILEDNWTAVTLDGQLSAQFEHTLCVTEDGCEILTRRDAVLENSERFPNMWS